MKRSTFVAGSLMTGLVATILPGLSTAAPSKDKSPGQYFELREYLLKDAAQQGITENYLQHAAIPALNRAGVQHVGVFTEMKPEGQTKLFILLTYTSLEQFAGLNSKLERDREYLQAAAAYLNAPVTAPAYERISSSLMKAFTHMPRLSVPAANTRIFELRQYQSASESAGKKKIEMFNDQGEIDIFSRLGFKPVFFGETLIGELRPNLTYMITFDDLAAHDAHWKSFGADSEWKKISSVPEYADALLVSKITSTLLVPATYSQI